MMLAGMVRPSFVVTSCGMRLDHQVADGENEAVLVDDDAGALALAAEIFGGARIRVDDGLDAHDRRQQFVGGRPLRSTQDFAPSVKQKATINRLARIIASVFRPAIIDAESNRAPSP